MNPTMNTKNRKPEDFILFWREYEEHGYMSQWYIAPMKMGDATYNCCEQRMMARKAVLFDDAATLAKIMEEADPDKQKKLGRRVKNFDKALWEAASREVVYEANLPNSPKTPNLPNSSSPPATRFS
jgi:ribA/ribD-fused uncharacterized protein